MLRAVAGTWLGTMCLALPLAAQSAQQSPPNDHSRALVVAAGFQHVTARNETASPFRFTGDGGRASITGERVTRHYFSSVTIGGGAAQLSSVATQSTERHATGDVDVNVLRRFAESGSFRLEAGLDIRESLDVTRHRFGLTSVAPTTYRWAMLSAGPMIRVEGAPRWASVVFTLTAPVAAAVDHPFSEVKNAYNAFSPKFASVNKLRSIDAGLSVTTTNRQRLRARLSLRANALVYLDDQPLRAVSNSVQLGLVLQSHQQ